MKNTWSVTTEDGYVKVYRGDTLIAAAIEHLPEKRVTDLEFMDPSYQKSNPTRQKVCRLLQEAGYK